MFLIFGVNLLDQNNAMFNQVLLKFLTVENMNRQRARVKKYTCSKLSRHIPNVEIGTPYDP